MNNVIFKKSNADQLWNIYGDFGYLNAPTQVEESCIFTCTKECHVSSEYIEDDNGVVLRKGRIKNISGHSITVNCLMSKFVLDGGDYEVYTQANTWQNESLGNWQPLVTAVSAETRGVRSAYGASPFFAVWNNQTGRGYAFHIMTKLPWHFEVRTAPFAGEANVLEIEAGINNRNFSVKLATNEELELPEIIYYEFRNKLDLDCYKLHHYINSKYPRREMPVVYNTWLYKFEKINFNNVVAQIKTAQELGVEYFVIDAAWFGDGNAQNFWNCRGDWYENQDDAFCGRMSEISEIVREQGMKFGFWLEIETAGPDSKMLQEHSEFYFTHTSSEGELYFFDFSNAKACDYMYETISGLLKKYQAQYIKFDFNQDLNIDIYQKAFMDYFKGYTELIKRLRNAYPDLYIENCASGGMRMSLENGLDFDSFWLSDNQSPYEGMRIFKDTLLRMPPQMIEKWATIQSMCEFEPCYGESPNEKIISTNDATWTGVRGVHQSYLEGFLTGGPIGFSCDLNSLSKTVVASLKEFIMQFKRDRIFWKNAVCRILANTESVLVLEYSDVNFERAEVLIYSSRLRQNSIRVYPKLDRSANYCVSGMNILSGAQIDTEGIEVFLNGNYTVNRLSIKQ